MELHNIIHRSIYSNNTINDVVLTLNRHILVSTSLSAPTNSGYGLEIVGVTLRGHKHKIQPTIW